MSHRLPKPSSDGSPSAPPAPTASSPTTDAPPGILVIRAATDTQFVALTAAILALVAPGDALGRLHAEFLVLAAERLRRAALLEPKDSLPDLAWCRFQSLAERNYRSAARDLRRHLADLAPKPPRASKSTPEPEPEPEAPEPPPMPESTPEEIADASANWRRYIALVKSVSEEFPILLRTGREVEDLAAWFGDGKTDEELMGWYPDVTKADLAACHACDAEGLCGPFDIELDGEPPGLPILDDLPEPEGPSP